MAANSLFASAIQILCYVAYVGAEGTNAEHLARSLKTNPVVVRRLLKAMEERGLVTIRQGRHGGVSLDRKPEEITLQDIYEAVGGGSLFVLRKQGNPRCPISRAMKDLLPAIFIAADMAVAKSLKTTKLTALIEKIA
jgi:DNA-binding IscR family transcriptional regulator